MSVTALKQTTYLLSNLRVKGSKSERHLKTANTENTQDQINLKFITLVILRNSMRGGHALT